jgi:uncharacterized damage-inducible protein DinB
MAAENEETVPKPQTMPRERQLLLSSLHDQRQHVLGILDDLPDEALRRPVLPSGWACVGLVNHLALDVERFWFRNVFFGEPVEQPADAWTVGPEVPVPEVLDLYRSEIELADAIIASTPLDGPPINWPERWPDWRDADLREAILHVITETATHAGHLDAVRELIDGKTWLVLD